MEKYYIMIPVFVFSIFLLAAGAFAASNQVVIQGTLTDDSAPLTGDRAWRVQYYDAQTGGSALGAPRSGTLTVSDTGRWSIHVTPPDEVLDATGEVWYELAIDSAASPDGSIDPEDVFPDRVKVESVLFAQKARNADTLDDLHGEDFITTSGPQYVFVNVDDENSDTENATALLGAYNQAKSLNPGINNRVAVIVPPGRYNLGDEGLTLDTPHLDLIGLTTDERAQYLYGTGEGSGAGVLIQTADNICIENVTVECTRSSGGVFYNEYDPAAYFPHSDMFDTVIENCEFRADDENAWTMRLNITYSGTYVDCTAGYGAFGGKGGAASGVFKRCMAREQAFGGEGTANGVFENCYGDDKSFGAEGTAGGIFTDCTGGDLAFAGEGSAIGKFRDCEGGYKAFGGYYGTASGTFKDCTGGELAFGGRGTASGTFNNCTGGYMAFGGSGTAPGGEFYYCRGGDSSFTSNGSPSPLRRYCDRNGTALND